MQSAASTLDKRYLQRYYLLTKVRRGGFIFITWVGDHGPRHVHVYRDGDFVLKWDLDNHQVMRGRVSRRLLRIIAELEQEREL